jgi:hypothetical protein
MSYVSEAGRITCLPLTAGQNVIKEVLQVHARISVETAYNNYFTVKL